MQGDLAFHKYEGLGNDFIVIDVPRSEREDFVSTDEAVALCDRRFGIGADGVLLLLPPTTTGAHSRMRVINADGSIPEMCGNGLRCAVLHVARKQNLKEIVFDTDAGLRQCAIDENDLVTVDMGVIQVSSTVTLEGYDFVLADAGNPHAITTTPATRSEIEKVGPVISTHPTFPNGTNVEFARFGPEGVELVVWERGCGITHACGTGACATVAVGVAKNLVARDVETPVHLPGGTLRVTITADNRAIMRGPARHVFSGRT